MTLKIILFFCYFVISSSENGSDINFVHSFHCKPGSSNCIKNVLTINFFRVMRLDAVAKIAISWIFSLVQKMHNIKPNHRPEKYSSIQKLRNIVCSTRHYPTLPTVLIFFLTA